ncbi:rhodanese-like domain-containing protein [Vibrio sp. SM6]|uniref:Rhodanese-like domain-containing protein n=1 Tax=Vibrio agarilyticus TaxID=2726741 RepID=A0A7X8TS98_9VIBR|nr:rhodanese-like domain-containing protein [Vibrio agarilyticus]NLS14022.1 rhodanese-like domain-containing protein [Vibrio agarilyticus]
MQEYIDFFQQNTIMALVWLGLFAALIMNIVKSMNAAYKEISVGQATHLINRENGVVIDIRTRDEFKKGHITDALHILPSEIKAGNFASLENHKSDPIIVVCRNGQAAQESANLLAKAGFSQVNVLKNGLTSWLDAKLPLIRGAK